MALTTKTPHDFYHRQRLRCKYRKDLAGNPIEFRLTFAQWWKIWQKSGKWELRGREKGCYVMSRKNDMGHYEPGNVVIILATQNVSDGVKRAWVVRKLKKAAECTQNET